MPIPPPSDLEQQLVERWADGDLFDGSRHTQAASDGRAPIRGVVIRALLTGANPAWPVAPGPLRMRRVRVTERLDLRAVRSRVDGRPVPRLEAEDCVFDEPIDVSGAVVAGLALRACEMPALWAVEAEVEGSLDLSGAALHGEETHGGDGRAAILGRGARLRGELSLCAHGAGREARRFEARAAIVLAGARIEGRLLAAGASLGAGDADWALDAEGAHVGGGVFLEGDRSGARAGDEGAGPWRFVSTGGVNFAGARLAQLVARTADVHATGAEGSAGVALRADGCTIGGLVSLGEGETTPSDEGNADLIIDGSIGLIGARLGELQVRAARVVALDGAALAADRVTAGSVNIAHARFVCGRGDRQDAIRLPGCDVRAGVSLSKIATKGAVVMHGARIGGRLRVTESELQGSPNDPKPMPDLLDLRGARIDGSLELGPITSPDGGQPRGLFLFDGARVALLVDDPVKSWPKAGGLMMDGFVYDALRNLGGESRRRWLRLQAPSDAAESGGDYDRQPYEHLARLLRDHGREDDANIIAREKRDQDLGRGPIGAAMRLLGHGYSRPRALLAVGIWWVLGMLWIWLAILSHLAAFERVHPTFEPPQAIGAHERTVEPYKLEGPIFAWPPWGAVPTSREAGSRGCPGVYVPLYAFELMAPVGEFGQEAECRLESEGLPGGLVQAWRVAYQVIGAFLLVVLGVAWTGLIRKD
jgi:hypothetical protein